MQKYLVAIEFRYSDAPKGQYDSDYKSKTTTIGVFDTLEEANSEGNKMLETLEKHFKIHVFPQGNAAPKERFSKNGGCFGTAKNLISNLAYLKTPFDFYAKITTLHYSDLEETIQEVLTAGKRYKEYKTAQV